MVGLLLLEPPAPALGHWKPCMPPAPTEGGAGAPTSGDGAGTAPTCVPGEEGIWAGGLGAERVSLVGIGAKMPETEGTISEVG